jgi:hypothetical protein
LTNAAGGAELAVNTADKRLFSINSSSAIIEVGTNPSSLTCADASFTVARVGSLTISSLSLTNVTVTSATVTTLTGTSANITNISGTSLTVSTATLSGGTANGVLYLNGSKVATSGSALTYNGTAVSSSASSAISGIFNRNTSSGATLQIQVVGSNVGTLGSDTGGNGWFDLAAASSIQLRATGASSFISFDANNAEGMRLTSTSLYTASGINVGIGTASPDANFKLDVQAATGRVKLTSTTGTNSVVYQANNTGGTLNVGIDSSTGGSLFGVGAYAAGVWYSGNYPLVFGVNNAEGFRLTSSTLYTASGINVGIGTSSPTQKLHVAGNILSLSAAGTDSYINVATNTVQNTYVGFNNSGSTNAAGAANNHSYFGSGNAYGIQFITNGSAAATINTSGNLGIGTSSPAAKLHVVGDSLSETFKLIANTAVSGSDATIFRPADNTMAFSTNGTERARISSDGTFRVKGAGTAGSTDAFLVDGAAPASAARITSGGIFLVGKASASQTTVGFQAEQDGIVSDGLAATANTTTTLNVYSTGAAAYRFYVGLGGTVYATNTTISAISDQRFKENISDLDAGLVEVMALKPRKFDWKEGKGKDIKGDRGFIAQEFEQVFPDLIDTWKDPAPEGEEPYKSVRQDLIPVLVKAIQEQQAMIKSLEAKVAALESK